MFTRRTLTAIGLTGLAGLGTAAGQTWDGGGSNDNWENSYNWSPNGVPANDGSANIIFSGSSGVAPTIASWKHVNSITFSASASTTFSIQGAATLYVGASGVVNNDTNDQWISTDGLALTANQSWMAASGDLIMLNDLLTIGSRMLIINGAHDTFAAGGAISSTTSSVIVKNGTGTFYLLDGGHDGTLTINSGKVVFGDADVLGPGSAAFVAPSATLDLNGYGEAFGHLYGSGDVINNDNFLSIGQDDSSFTCDNDIFGTGRIDKEGTGIMSLGSSFTTTCPSLRVLEGELRPKGRLTNATAVTVNYPGFIDCEALTTTFGSLSGDGRVDAPGGHAYLYIGGNNAFASYGGYISGIGHVVKQGSGIWNLSGFHTFTGSLRVADGTLIMQPFSNLNDALPVTVDAGATFTLNNGYERVGNLSGAGDVRILGGNLDIGANDANAAFSGRILGTGMLSKHGSGVWTLSGDMVDAGTLSVDEGTVRLTASADIDNLAMLGVSPGAVLDMDGTDEVVGNLRGGGSVINCDGLLAFGDDNTAQLFAGSITGSGRVEKRGSAIWTLNGDVMVTDRFSILEGRVNMGAGSDISNSADVVVAHAAILDLNGTAQGFGSLAGAGNVIDNNDAAYGLHAGFNGASTSFSGVISGSGKFEKEGAGRMELTAANTYSGGTFIDQGALLANNTSGQATGPGMVTVGDGGLLGGKGSVGPITVQSGGVVAPGGTLLDATHAQSLFANGNVIFQDGSALEIELGGTSAGVSYDQFVIGGSVVLNGELRVSLINGFRPVPGDEFTVLVMNGHAGDFDSQQLPPRFRKVWSGQNIKVVYDGCPGDADGNGAVGQDDIDIVLFNFLQHVPRGTQGDLNGDSVVDQDDIDLVLFHYGDVCP